MDYNPDCPAWGSLTWPKVGEFNLANGAKGGLPLQDALCQYFIRCKIGNTDLRYDAWTRRLYWRDTDGLIVAVQFSIPYRVRLNVQVPARNRPNHVDKEIAPAEIHNHRMDVAPEEVLMPVLTAADANVKAMKRTLAMTYHPDRYSSFDQLFQDIATRRMQEVNAASGELLRRKKSNT